MSYALPRSTGPSSSASVSTALTASVVSDVFTKAKALIARQSEVVALRAQANVLLSKLPDLRAPIVDSHGNLREDVDEMVLRAARVRMGEVMDDANHVMEQAMHMSEEVNADLVTFMHWISDEKTWEGLDQHQVRLQLELELQSFPRMDTGTLGVGVQQPTRDAVHDLIHSFDSLALSTLPSSTSFPMDVCLGAPPASLATSTSHEDTHSPTLSGSSSHSLHQN